MLGLGSLGYADDHAFVNFVSACQGQDELGVVQAHISVFELHPESVICCRNLAAPPVLVF